MTLTRFSLVIFIAVFIHTPVFVHADTLSDRLTDLATAQQSLGYALLGKPGFELITHYENALADRLGENKDLLDQFQKGFAELEKIYTALAQERKQITNAVLQKKRALTGVRDEVTPQKYPGYDDDKKALEQSLITLKGMSPSNALSQEFIERLITATNALNRKNGIIDMLAKIFELLKKIQKSHTAFVFSTSKNNASGAVSAKESLKEGFEGKFEIFKKDGKEEIKKVEPGYDDIAGKYEDLYTEASKINTALEAFISQVKSRSAQKFAFDTLASIAPRLLLETEHRAAQEDLASLLNATKMLNLSEQQEQITLLGNLVDNIFKDPRLAIKAINDAEQKGLKPAITGGIRKVIQSSQEPLSWLAKVVKTPEIEDILKRAQSKQAETQEEPGSDEWD